MLNSKAKTIGWSMANALLYEYAKAWAILLHYGIKAHFKSHIYSVAMKPGTVDWKGWLKVEEGSGKVLAESQLDKIWGTFQHTEAGIIGFTCMTVWRHFTFITRILEIQEGLSIVSINMMFIWIEVKSEKCNVLIIVIAMYDDRCTFMYIVIHHVLYTIWNWKNRTKWKCLEWAITDSTIHVGYIYTYPAPQDVFNLKRWSNPNISSRGFCRADFLG